MFVLLNRHSNNGRGRRRWEESREELEAGPLGRDYRLANEAEDLSVQLSRAFAAGERVFVAAGGDGTVNFLLNAVMTADGVEPREVILGAVGLGSSNDFHKPYGSRARTRAGVFTRLDTRGAYAHNIARADYDDETGARRRRHFIINGSLGIIARGNHLFNSDEPVVRWLKPKWVLGTIWYLTLKTLLTTGDLPVRITVGGDVLTARVTTLSVIINPHFTGSLSYDCGDYSGRDRFGIALCDGMGTLERLRTLSSFSRGKFSGLRKTRFWEASAVSLEPECAAPLEMDGEVVLAKNIEISLLKGAIKTCP